MIATSIEQSKRLLELGLDPKTADMYWIHVQSQTRDFWKLEVIQRYWRPFKGVDSDIHAWSLYALLEVMRKLNATITLQIIGNFTFLRIKDNCFIWQKDIHVKNPMDAVYGGMLWLFEQGLIKKGDNDE